MRKSILWFVFLTLLTIQSAFAQGFFVKGKVISQEDNEPLIGVSILQEGSTNGVVTDVDGNYSLEIKGTARATLLFSYIGMQSQKHEVSAKTGTLNVRLAPDAALIDEVVVVAYGVRKKGTIAGSVSTVKSEKMENVPAAGFDQALQGQTPGLSVISNSGEPSKAAVFQIRGTNSINSGTSPLFILDGVPISSSDFNTISPGDIESISVLKDASSTSIYGARAANGVVVITTKRGLAMDKAKVTLRAQYGFSQLASNDNWTMMNTPERIQFEKEIGLDTGQDYEILSRTNVNWLNEVFNDRAPELRTLRKPRYRTLELLRFRRFLRPGRYCPKLFLPSLQYARQRRSKSQQRVENRNQHHGRLRRSSAGGRGRNGALYSYFRFPFYVALLEPVQCRRFFSFRKQRNLGGNRSEPY